VCVCAACTATACVMADFRQPPKGANAKFVRRSSAFTGIVGMAVGALMVYSQWEMWRMRSEEPHHIDRVTQQNLERTKAEREAIKYYHEQRRLAEQRRRGSGATGGGN